MDTPLFLGAQQRDGRFVNRDGSGAPPFSRVFKWAVRDKLAGRRRRTPRRSPVESLESAHFPDGEPGVTWLGHSTLFIDLGGVRLLTDPIFAASLTPRAPRNIPVLARADELPGLDWVLLSHAHRDHLDRPSVLSLERRWKPHYAVPLGLDRFLRRWGIPAERVVALDWGQSVADLDDLGITCLPARHWSQRELGDRNRTLWCSFLVRRGGNRVYYVGDSALDDVFAEIGDAYPGIDLALVPIGAYEPEDFMTHQHMAPEQALECFEGLAAKRMLSIHWGTYKLADEALDDPPQRLAAALASKPYAERVLTLPQGSLVPLADPKQP